MVDRDGGVPFLAVCVVSVTDVDVDEDKKRKAGWIKQERELKKQKTKATTRIKINRRIKNPVTLGEFLRWFGIW